MKNTKRWIRTWGLTVSILFVIGIINFIVDPYQQYRKASFYKIPYESPRELNAGLAKNFDFASVVIGTSMMENFNLADVRSTLYFDRPIKLTMPGSSIYEQNLMLRTAFRHHEIHQVLIGIDFLSYYGDVHRFKYGESFFPTYLYDENIFNDYKYLFSSDTLSRTFELFTTERQNKRLYDYDHMYEWISRTHPKDVLSALRNKWEKRQEFDNKATDREKRLEFMKENFRHNLLPLIEEHPETHFVIFFPPYSILAFKTYEERTQLQDLLAFKVMVVTTLLSYDNVSLYDFQNDNSKIYELENYFDLYHYNKKISKWILKSIEQKHFKIIDVKRYQQDSQTFLKSVKNFQVSMQIFTTK